MYTNQYYSRSQNNVNLVYCNYKEITSSYSVNTKRNLPYSLPYFDYIFKMFVWNLEEACVIKKSDQKNIKIFK